MGVRRTFFIREFGRVKNSLYLRPMKTNLQYQQVTQDDKNHSVEVTFTVSELKYLYNLLVDVPSEMIGYKETAMVILQALKDQQFDKEFENLPF